MKKRLKLTLEQLEDRLAPSANPLSVLGNSPSSYSIDGSGNNLLNPDWGSTDSQLIRSVAAEYSDGLSAPAGQDRPSARVVSNAVADQGDEEIVSDRLLSALIFAWGQFVDHDLDLTAGGTTEFFPISVPAGDPQFDPAGTGAQVIPLMRSAAADATGTDTPRQQLNRVSAWMDGSMIYGSDAETAASLRTFSGGQLKTSEGDLLPLDENGFFMAGDIRANENPELTSLHTLFVREHNRIAAEIAAAQPGLDDEGVFQRARAQVIAELQVITYKEWLPALLGPNALDAYRGYRPQVDPGIANEFATAAFRLGHSLLGDDIEFLDNNGQPIADGVSLAEAFFNPALVSEHGIDSILKYLASDPSSELDTKVVDSVRNFLFGPPGAGGLDLASLNIQRGRDHGLADYNAIRQAYGLRPVTSFAQITSDPELQAKLQELYGSVNNIDPWVGMLAEDHVRGGSVGPTLRAVISDQFERLRDGDRFWYRKVYSGQALKALENTTLADVIRRNTDLTNLQKNVFFFKAGISGTVFGDRDHDGRLDRGERALAGRIVELVNADSGAVVATTQTNARGQYRFEVPDGLGVGRYLVRELPPPGAVPTTPPRIIAITRGDMFVTDAHLGEAPAHPGGPPHGPGPGNPMLPPPPAGVTLAHLPPPGDPGLAPPPPPAGLEAPPPQPGTPPAGAPPCVRGLAFLGMSPLSRQLFEQVRQELLQQARNVLTEEQFRALEAGLNPPPPQPGQNGVYENGGPAQS